MEIFMSALTAVGGLAFFLFGMNMLGASLEKAAGGKMQQALEKMTSNVVKSLLLGILVTAAIQSSSATTVIVVGLVNAGILRLRNAIGVIMGANIGTTVTSLILSLADPTHAQTSNMVLNLFKPATFTPVIALVAIVILMTAKKSRTRLVSEIMFGFAILFNGMMIMTNALEPLSELPAFSQIFQTLSNPFVGLLAGTLITAIIQSSSASVAILQTAASTGLVPFSAAVPIILGQNIGTCVTSLLSSIGANKNARRAAMVHLYFNIIGTVIFFIGMYAIQWTIGFSFWNDPVSMSGISYFHITFNVLTTLLLLPFTRLLEKLAVLTIRDKKSVQGEDEDVPVVAVLDSRFLLSPSLALSHVKEVVEQMGEYAKKNFVRSVSMFEKFDPARKERIMNFEDAIDQMEDKLNRYLVELTNSELSEQDSQTITYYLKLIMEFERIGDYSINVLELAERLHDQQAKLSGQALSELGALSDAVTEIIDMAVVIVKTDDLLLASHVEPLEETVDKMEDTLKFRHIERLKAGKCTVDGGIVFLELLTNLERISDHCSNIAVHLIGYHHHLEMFDRHEYLKELHASAGTAYSELFQEYNEKYFSRIRITK